MSALVFWRVIDFCAGVKTEKAELSYQCTVRNNVQSCSRFIEKWPDNIKEQRHLDYLLGK